MCNLGRKSNYHATDVFPQGTVVVICRRVESLSIYSQNYLSQKKT